jgi:DNA-directed RNA polymerase subunit RPC12/RpoP
VGSAAVGLVLVGALVSLAGAVIYTCIQCRKLVPELVQIRPGNGQSRPPMKRCRECAEAYRKLMRERNVKHNA